MQTFATQQAMSPSNGNIGRGFPRDLSPSGRSHIGIEYQDAEAIAASLTRAKSNMLVLIKAVMDAMDVPMPPGFDAAPRSMTGPKWAPHFRSWHAAEALGGSRAVGAGEVDVRVATSRGGVSFAAAQPKSSPTWASSVGATSQGENKRNIGMPSDRSLKPVQRMDVPQEPPRLTAFSVSSTTRSPDSDLFLSETEEEFAPAACMRMASAVQVEPCEMTTLMIRNIPSAYTQEMLMVEWPSIGTYDFLYLPLSCKGTSNLGYAFINFVSQAQAQEFKIRWHRQKLAHVDGKKTLNVSLADVQGFEANIKSLREKPSRRVRAKHFKPFIMREGRQIDMSEI